MALIFNLLINLPILYLIGSFFWSNILKLQKLFKTSPKEGKFGALCWLICLLILLTMVFLLPSEDLRKDLISITPFLFASTMLLQFLFTIPVILLGLIFKEKNFINVYSTFSILGACLGFLYFQVIRFFN